VRLYAHRGSPGPTSVENTVPAVTSALSCPRGGGGGADGVEVDLRLSRDGVLVVCHDPDLRRLADSPLAVADSTWNELRRTCAARSVPLARAEWLLAAAAGRPVVLELKQPPPGRTPLTAVALVHLLTSLTAAGLPLDVTVSSFSPALVAAVRTTAPASLRLRTALLGRLTDRPTGLVRRALDAGHDEVHPHVTALLAEPVAVERAHAVGVTVVPWTVNRARALRRLAALGVDAMITDVPTAARLALAPGRAVAA
jgi:glycerophosphoryl diester phosphodiesterase